MERIVCVTPPTKDGTLDAAILAACKIAGVTEIYTVGGAQAVAALAYGTETIRPVAKITGPGNAFVAAAKKLVSGDVGIDMIAGPSEVCVVADETADPRLVAIDLMAQAEHDPLGGLLPRHLLGRLRRRSGGGHPGAPGRFHPRRHHPHLPGRPRAHRRVHFHGSGPGGSERHRARALGDARGGRHGVPGRHPQRRGHLLGRVDARRPWAITWPAPTTRCPPAARPGYSSPLSVDDFVKKSSIIQYSPAALKNDARAVVQIATHEGLWAMPARWPCVLRRCWTPSRPSVAGSAAAGVEDGEARGE